MIRDQETLDQLVSLIDRFVSERLVPRENELAESEKLPDDVLTEMKELGLFGLTIPEEYGGLDYGRGNSSSNIARSNFTGVSIDHGDQ